MKSLKDIVGMALKTEEEGAKFYRETARKARNPLVTATFEFLAHEEDEHIKIFREYAETEKVVDPDTLSHPHINARDGIKKIFDRTSKQNIQHMAEKDVDRTEAYKAALAMEQKSYDLYKSTLDEATGDKEKKVLQFLCDQENKHYRILDDSKEFLDNPGDWFQKEERWMQT
ncbi:MAG: hypothetical protein GF384_07095 [Elusimicrobia bacterium]|nr:hypothetical protein [Elusimicrobiota bacterium]